MLFLVRNPKKDTPETKTHPSRPSFDLNATQIRQLLVQASTDYDAERQLVRRHFYHRLWTLSTPFDLRSHS